MSWRCCVPAAVAGSPAGGVLLVFILVIPAPCCITPGNAATLWGEKGTNQTSTVTVQERVRSHQDEVLRSHLGLLSISAGQTCSGVQLGLSRALCFTAGHPEAGREQLPGRRQVLAEKRDKMVTGRSQSDELKN